MTLFLERGYSVPQTNNFSGCRIFSGEPLSPYLNHCVTFQFNASGCDAQYLNQGKCERLSLRKKGALYQSETKFADHFLLFGKSLWFEMPTFNDIPNAPTVYVPFHGWAEGQWWDGPLIQWGDDKLMSAFVPVGLPAVLQVSSQKKDSAPATQPTPKDQTLSWQMAKGTLIAALHQRFSSRTAGFLLYPQQFDLREALWVVLFRTAFPKHLIRSNAMPEVIRIPCWRRLLQNCGILHGRAPQQVSRPEAVNLHALKHLLPDHLLQTLIQGCNELSAVIPPKIFSAS